MRFPSKKPLVAFGLPYLLSELFYIGIPVVLTDRRTYGHVTTKTSEMNKQPNFFTFGALQRALRTRKSTAKTELICKKDVRIKHGIQPLNQVIS